MDNFLSLFYNYHAKLKRLNWFPLMLSILWAFIGLKPNPGWGVGTTWNFLSLLFDIQDSFWLNFVEKILKGPILVFRNVILVIQNTLDMNINFQRKILLVYRLILS